MSDRNIDPNDLMAEVRDGLRQPHGQDGVIAALELLGKMGESRAVPLFKQALRHTNNGTRTTAALALCRCGDLEGLAALTNWASDVYGNPKGAVQAIYKLAELAKIGDPHATEALRKLQREQGSTALMFRGDDRPVSWIVDSLIGPPSDGQTAQSSVKGIDQQKPGGACFVATAACGDRFAPEVIVLSAFRDEVLLQHRIGRAFVRLYYTVSPAIAAVIGRSTTLRRAVMAFIVRPIVQLLRRFQETEPRKQE